MSDASPFIRTNAEAAFDRMTSTLFIFAVLAMASALLLIGPCEALDRLAVVSRRVLHLLGV